ncbi:hypothetical protein AJ79_04581 [Helicocarpus griseus UAMH5409]|uniref:GST C-terminal domain-containing protein n=1 Tax=Helicocarpus griseus UAMH5409 TaxID=1447875 RepID=A0A2B7XSC5_9EURO|nr:hypothetical protein AJ79_04581 [Helicocarpus griseus UAMH5409]
MPALKFWHYPGSCSLAPHILLRELNLDVEVIQPTDLSAAAFGTINPKLRIPVLSIDGEIVTEVPAILTAIAQLAPAGHSLLGKTPLETARAYEWMNWLSGYLHGSCYGGLWRPERFTDDSGALQGIKEKAQVNIKNAYGFVEERLGAGGLYAVGDGFTVVDLYLLVFYRWGKQIGLEMEREFPKYTDAMKNLVKRESVVKTLEETKLAPVFEAKI